MKNRNKYIAAASILILAILAAFAPPGVVFSPQTHLAPPSSIVDESSSTDALIVTGTSPIIDGPLVSTDIVTGIHVFRVHETTGLEIDFALEGALGVTGTARVWRAIPITAGQSIDDPVSQYTYRHICDVSLTASAQAGVSAGVVRNTLRWSSIIVTSSADGGLSTKAVNGTTLNAAGSLFVDPVCAPYIVVQVKRDTASGVMPLAMNWTRN